MRPTVIELSGVEHHTVQGSACVFTCEVFGARPAANITWSNSTATIDPEDESDIAEITTTAVSVWVSVTCFLLLFEVFEGMFWFYCLFLLKVVLIIVSSGHDAESTLISY